MLPPLVVSPMHQDHLHFFRNFRFVEEASRNELRPNRVRMSLQLTWVMVSDMFYVYEYVQHGSTFTWDDGFPLTHIFQVS